MDHGKVSTAVPISSGLQLDSTFFPLECAIKMAIKHSISWWCFEEILQPAKLIHAAVDIGYDGFDLVPVEHWPAIRDAGLELAAVNGHDSLEEGLNRADNHDQIERQIIAKLDTASRHGVHHLICFSGNRGDTDDREGIDVTVAGLERVAGAAEQAGITLVLELLNSKIDHPDYQCDRTAWGVEVITRIDSPCVKLLYDIYHMQIMEGDLVRTIRENHAHFAHYHTGGNPGRNEIDTHQEIYYPAVVHAIADTGYDDYIGQEFIPLGDPVAALREALAICRL